MKTKALLSILCALVLVCTAIAPAFAEEENGFFAVIPLPDQLLDATFAGRTKLEDGNYLYVYENAARDDLDYFLVLCAMLGNYAKPISDDGTQYRLYVPGQDYMGYALYSAEDRMVGILDNGTTPYADDELLSSYYRLLATEVTLPADASGNVAPQFYAGVGTAPYQSVTTQSASLFDGQACWTEYYDGIGRTQLQAYTLAMLLFGFEVRAETRVVREKEENMDAMDILQLSYDNGDARILVSYEALSQTAIVYYKPGVSYYLLNSTQLAEALAQ